MTSLLQDEPLTLIDELLAEQQSLTAVERFARQHEAHALPAQARYYRALIPLVQPQLGEQYAFGVDLDACTGCKACVSACHSLNGLDDDELWRDVGLLHGGMIGAPYQQTVTTACHHCVEPACLAGCPVRAYEKDSATGIVRHLDDQCIGCQYCVLKCPYDVPKYSKKRGIVRKCDMCHSRLTAGEAPACVQACPTSAISIRIISKAAVITQRSPGDRMLPGAFESHYTQPATTYSTRKSIPANARPGDAHALRLEHAHWPLIGMLVLTQLAAGLFLAASVLAFANSDAFAAAQGWLGIGGFLALQAGLAVSVLHLGRPLGAWRAFLGLRTSWMSREILAFSVFAAAAGACAASSIWPWLAARWPALDLVNLAPFAAPLTHCTALLALLGVACSAMIYVDTRRAFWDREQTFTKFFGTTFLLGAAGAAALLSLAGGPREETARAFAMVATVVRAALFGWEFQSIRALLLDRHAPAHRSALLMWKLQRPLLGARLALFAATMIFGLLACGLADPRSGAALVAFLLTAAGAVSERYVFFTAVVAPRMPGPLTPQ